MKSAASSPLERECEVFCQYLAGIRPDAYVRGKYEEAHRVARDYEGGGPFDRLLLGLASNGPVFASFADSYASLLARRSLLRRKLILLLAILESCAPARGFQDSPDGGPLPALYLRIAGRGVNFLLRFLVSAVVLLPLQTVRGGFRRSGE